MYSLQRSVSRKYRLFFRSFYFSTFFVLTTSCYESWFKSQVNPVCALWAHIIINIKKLDSLMLHFLIFVVTSTPDLKTPSQERPMDTDRVFFTVMGLLFVLVALITAVFSLITLVTIITCWHSHCRSISNFLVCNSCLTTLFFDIILFPFKFRLYFKVISKRDKIFTQHSAGFVAFCYYSLVSKRYVHTSFKRSHAISSLCFPSGKTFSPTVRTDHWFWSVESIVWC